MSTYELIFGSSKLKFTNVNEALMIALNNRFVKHAILLMKLAQIYLLFMRDDDGYG